MADGLSMGSRFAFAGKGSTRDMAPCSFQVGRGKRAQENSTAASGRRGNYRDSRNMILIRIASGLDLQAVGQTEPAAHLPCFPTQTAAPSLPNLLDCGICGAIFATGLGAELTFFQQERNGALLGVWQSCVRTALDWVRHCQGWVIDS